MSESGHEGSADPDAVPAGAAVSSTPGTGMPGVPAAGVRSVSLERERGGTPAVFTPGIRLARAAAARKWAIPAPMRRSAIVKLVRLTDAPPTASNERNSEPGRSASIPWMTPRHAGISAGGSPSLRTATVIVCTLPPTESSIGR